jgi:hypothetical protein
MGGAEGDGGGGRQGRSVVRWSGDGRQAEKTALFAPVWLCHVVTIILFSVSVSLICVILSYKVMASTDSSLMKLVDA